VTSFLDRVGDLLAGFTVLDWVLVGLVVMFAVIGWVQGFVVGLLSLVGFVGGAALGLMFVPRLLSSLDPGLGTAVLAILLVLLAAAVGQWLLSSIGSWARQRLGGEESARRLDGLAGALLGAMGVLLVAWLVGSAVASATVPWLSAQARESTVLAAVNDVVPVDPEVVREPLREVVSSAGFPEVVAPWVPEMIFAVPDPDPGADSTEQVRAALPSVVKVLGRAESCSATLEGSGVVVQPGRVLTNAHVVAGTDRVVIAPVDGEPVVASVVYLDTATDVAVLAAPDLPSPVATLEPDLVSPGTDAVVAGFPGGGGLDTESARVRSTSNVIGLDIYGNDQVLREVVAFRGQVRPGNSGGPLLSTDGQVIGLVFAASLTDPDTGYALAQSQLAAALEVAAGPEVDPVASTGACA
jgi:S1-C subfamily serine protease